MIPRATFFYEKMTKNTSHIMQYLFFIFFTIYTENENDTKMIPHVENYDTDLTAYLYKILMFIMILS